MGERRQASSLGGQTSTAREEANQGPRQGRGMGLKGVRVGAARGHLPEASAGSGRRRGRGLERNGDECAVRAWLRAFGCFE